MNNLTKVVSVDKILISQLHEIQKKTYLNKEKTTNEININISDDNFVYDIVLLNKIWLEYVQTILFKGMGDCDLFFEYVDIQFYIDNYMAKDSKLFENLDKSLNNFLNLLEDLRNNPEIVISAFENCKEFFTDFKNTCLFQSDLKHIFDLSGLLYNEKLIENNFYFKKTLLANQY